MPNTSTSLPKALERDHLLITYRIGCRDSAGLSHDIWHQCLARIKLEGSIMAKRKKQPSKVQKKKASRVLSKTRKLTKLARGKASKRTVARANSKRAEVKKAAKPVTATAVETVAVEELNILPQVVTTVTAVKEAEAPQGS
jgi:hypothetical protein